MALIIHCPKCGTPAAEKEAGVPNFCVKCGTVLHGQPMQSGQGQTPFAGQNMYAPYNQFGQYQQPVSPQYTVQQQPYVQNPQYFVQQQNPIQNQSQFPAVEQKKPKSRKKKLIIILSASLSVMLVVGIIVLTLAMSLSQSGGGGILDTRTPREKLIGFIKENGRKRDDGYFYDDMFFYYNNSTYSSELYMYYSMSLNDMCLALVSTRNDNSETFFRIGIMLQENNIHRSRFHAEMDGVAMAAGYGDINAQKYSIGQRLAFVEYADKFSGSFEDDSIELMTLHVKEILSKADTTLFKDAGVNIKDFGFTNL
jgi:flagellar basal body-associated protein FliL